jgi:hypothetical protein
MFRKALSDEKGTAVEASDVVERFARMHWCFLTVDDAGHPVSTSGR